MVVAGRADAGTTIPPVSAVNEIATPEATTIATVRPVTPVMSNHLPLATGSRMSVTPMSEAGTGFAALSPDRLRNVPPTGFHLCTKPFNLAFQLSTRMTAFSQRPPTKVTESRKNGSGACRSVAEQFALANAWPRGGLR